jgi:hypothetical protein
VNTSEGSLSDIKDPPSPRLRRDESAATVNRTLVNTVECVGGCGSQTRAPEGWDGPQISSMGADSVSVAANGLFRSGKEWGMKSRKRESGKREPRTNPSESNQHEERLKSRSGSGGLVGVGVWLEK